MVTSAPNPAKRKRHQISTVTSDNYLSPDINGACKITARTCRNDLRPNFFDAIRYLVLLREILDADKYQNFLEIMKGVQAESIRPAECVEMVKDLLRGYSELFSGFLDFIPKDLDKIDCSPSEKKLEYKDTFAFVYKVKSRFSNNVQKFDSFLYILNMYKTGLKSMDEVYREVIVLFQDHADLIQEFSYFIQKASLEHRDGGGHSITHGV